MLSWSKADAHPNDLFVALRYEVEASPRGCWDEPKFRRGVANRIGYDPFREDAPLTVRIHVGGNTLAVDGQVEWRNANGEGMGERRFVAKDGNCGKLMTEMSFAVGLQIEFLRLKPPKQATTGTPGGSSSASEPNALPTTPRDESTSAAPGANEASPPPVDETPPPMVTSKQEQPKPEPIDRTVPETPVPDSESPPRSPAHWSLWAGAGPALAWRLSPHITADGRVFLGVRRNHLSAEFAAEATYPSTFRRWDGSGFRQTLVGGTLAVCGHIDWFAACALGRASQVRITGLGVDQPREPNGFVGQLGARLGAAFPVAGPWWVAAHVDGLVLLTHSTVRLNQAPVWDMPRLGAVIGADVLARFR